MIGLFDWLENTLGERKINIMKIAIIDDDSIFMDEVKDIIGERINKIGINDFSISTFSSPEQLLVDIHSFIWFAYYRCWN